MNFLSPWWGHLHHFQIEFPCTWKVFLQQQFQISPFPEKTSLCSVLVIPPLGPHRQSIAHKSPIIENKNASQSLDEKVFFYYFLLLVTSTVGGRVLTLVWYFVLVSDVPTGVTNVTLHGTIDMIHIKCKCPATQQTSNIPHRKL